jgi:hypothetical protein
MRFASITCSSVLNLHASKTEALFVDSLSYLYLQGVCTNYYIFLQPAHPEPGRVVEIRKLFRRHEVDIRGKLQDRSRWPFVD